MAARRNIVPTAEISIAATVVDPSSLLFVLFLSFFPVSPFLPLSSTCHQERSEVSPTKSKDYSPSESANWARLINWAALQRRPMNFRRERISGFNSHDITNRNFLGFCTVKLLNMLHFYFRYLNFYFTASIFVQHDIVCNELIKS